MANSLIIADRNTRKLGAGNFTIEDEPVIKVAIQKSGRVNRRGRTYVIYACGEAILYNYSESQPYWSTFGEYIIGDTKDESGNTVAEKWKSRDVFRYINREKYTAWLERNNYELIG